MTERPKRFPSAMERDRSIGEIISEWDAGCAALEAAEERKVAYYTPIVLDALRACITGDLAKWSISEQAPLALGMLEHPGAIERAARTFLAENLVRPLAAGETQRDCGGPVQPAKGPIVTDDKCPFEDIEYINFRDGGRFETPSRRERQNIAPGDLAQVAYRGEHGVENLWVEVDELTPDGYRGCVDSAPPSVSLQTGDVVRFSAKHVISIYRRQATTANADYIELLADAQALDAPKYWKPVEEIEQAAMEVYVPASMRGTEGTERRADYLRRHPQCASCEARGHVNAAVYPVLRSNNDVTADDSNIDPLCHICLYVLTARRKGWPVRGSDLDGMPNDPTHPWNR